MHTCSAIRKSETPRMTASLAHCTDLIIVVTQLSLLMFGGRMHFLFGNVVVIAPSKRIGCWGVSLWLRIRSCCSIRKPVLVFLADVINSTDCGSKSTTIVEDGGGRDRRMFQKVGIGRQHVEHMWCILIGQSWRHFQPHHSLGHPKCLSYHHGYHYFFITFHCFSSRQCHQSLWGKLM